jgi:hypothetical protein
VSIKNEIKIGSDCVHVHLIPFILRTLEWFLKIMNVGHVLQTHMRTPIED